MALRVLEGELALVAWIEYLSGSFAVEAVTSTQPAAVSSQRVQSGESHLLRMVRLRYGQPDVGNDRGVHGWEEWGEPVQVLPAAFERFEISDTNR